MPRQLSKRDEALFELGKPVWCKQRTKPMEVMCLGLGRTGTTSMYEAMAILGYGTMYNTREAMKRSQLPLLGQMLINKHTAGGQHWPPPLERFESLWGEYTTISGDVVYPFAEECIRLYPEAKIVLTVREDEERWLRSMQETMWHNRNHWTTPILQRIDPLFVELASFIRPFWKYFYGGDLPNQGLRVYREHNALVQRLGGDRCLVYCVKEGWEPLCKFLEKPVPAVPFPNENDTQNHRLIFSTARQQAFNRLLKTYVARLGASTLVLGLLWWKRAPIRTVLQSAIRSIWH